MWLFMYGSMCADMPLFEQQEQSHMSVSSGVPTDDISVYPQDGDWVSRCLNYYIDAWLKNCMVHGDLHVLRCIAS